MFASPDYAEALTDLGVHMVNLGAPTEPRSSRRCPAPAARGRGTGRCDDPLGHGPMMRIAGDGPVGDVHAPMLERYTVMGFLATPTRNVNYSCSSPVRVSATGAAREDRPQPGTVGASRMPGEPPVDA
jgi:hypothetical protein